MHKTLIKIRVLSSDIIIFFKVFITIIIQYIASINKLSIPSYKIVSPAFNCSFKKEHSEIASTFVVVFQGPVFGKFTIETIDFYRKIHPELKIIVSTWLGLPVEINKELNKRNVIILENRDVLHSYDNQNRMISSTFAGIAHAKKLYPDSFVIKHRCDQRLTHFDWLRNIEDLLLSYPAKNSIGTPFRIGSISVCSGKLRPYMLGDQFQFGHIEDMMELWSAPNVEIGLHQLFDYFEFNGFIKNGFGIKADNYLIGYYIRKKGLKFDFSLVDSNKFWAAKGIVIDANSVGFHWARKEFNKKLESYVDCNPFNGSLSNSHGVSCMSFADWLHIYRTGSLSYNGLMPEVWIVKCIDNGLPTYQIVNIGGISDSL
jgi:hypothetical protein